MPSLIDIRRRVRSVKNTQQITKAMKMVAAAKLRRAQDKVIAARPYAQMLEKMLGNVAAAARMSDAGSNPLLAVRPEKRIQLLLVTADRGLAGAFNGNLIKGAQRFLADHAAAEVRIECLGRKGRDFFKRRDAKISGEHLGLLTKVEAAAVQKIAATVIERYNNGEIDSVYIIYNEFKSVLSQKLLQAKLLPVDVSSTKETSDYIYEQPAAQLLDTLLPKYVENGIYRALLESAAAEHAARMTAMDSATRNASEVIEKLTLYMNRVRQASITKEIIEVVSGAAALE
jgi:F-type H+-transporting ATPase subunit gamma